MGCGLNLHALRRICASSWTPSRSSISRSFWMRCERLCWARSLHIRKGHKSSGTMRSWPSISFTSSAKSTNASLVLYNHRQDTDRSLAATSSKGRAAFCEAPPAVKGQPHDYSQYPLTAHGAVLFAMVQSGIVSYPHRAVSLQYFESVARYPDFFKVRKECIPPTLEAMIDSR